MPRMSLNDLQLSAATAVVAGTGVAATDAVSTGSVRVMGYVVKGTTLTLYDGTATTATSFIPVESTATGKWFGPQGIRFDNGLLAVATDTDASTVFYLVDE